jgi:hypothetical protein
LIFGQILKLSSLLAISKHFEMLMESFMKNQSTAMNLLDYASCVLNSIEEGWLVDSIHIEIPNTID